MFTASQGAGGRLFQKNRRPSLAIVPCPLLPCQQALACALAHAISVHFTSSSKANKQGPPQYLRKQLFLSSECQCWRICWSGVSKRQDIDTLPHFKHSKRNSHSWTLTPFLKLAVHSSEILLLITPPETQTSLHKHNVVKTPSCCTDGYHRCTFQVFWSKTVWLVKFHKIVNSQF